MDETATLAKYAANLRYEDIPQEVLERARNTICDTVGAIIFGFGLPWSQMIVDYAKTYGPRGKSRILGPGGGLVQPAMAARTETLSKEAMVRRPKGASCTQTPSNPSDSASHAARTISSSP